MKLIICLAALLLSSCTHRLILVYESEEAASLQSRFFFNPEVSPQPKLPEAKHASN